MFVAQPDVEAFLAAVLDEVLVAADPRRLESLRGELLQLVRHEVDMSPAVSGRLRTSTVASGDTEDCTTVSLAIGEVTMEDGGLYVILVSSEAGAAVFLQEW